MVIAPELSKSLLYLYNVAPRRLTRAQSGSAGIGMLQSNGHGNPNSDINGYTNSFFDSYTHSSFNSERNSDLGSDRNLDRGNYDVDLSINNFRHNTVQFLRHLYTSSNLLTWVPRLHIENPIFHYLFRTTDFVTCILDYPATTTDSGWITVTE
jgi:hypothetical protein